MEAAADLEARPGMAWPICVTQEAFEHSVWELRLLNMDPLPCLMENIFCQAPLARNPCLRMPMHPVSPVILHLWKGWTNLKVFGRQLAIREVACPENPNGSCRFQQQGSRIQAVMETLDLKLEERKKAPMRTWRRTGPVHQ